VLRTDSRPLPLLLVPPQLLHLLLCREPPLPPRRQHRRATCCNAIVSMRPSQWIYAKDIRDKVNTKSVPKLFALGM